VRVVNRNSVPGPQHHTIVQAVKFVIVPVVLVVLALIGSLRAEAQRPDASDILKRMTDYVAAQQTISAIIDTQVEVLTTELPRIQFTSSAQVLLSRPDKVRAIQTGGPNDMELVYDGGMLSILGINRNVYAQVRVPGTFDKLIDRLRSRRVVLPFADLLRARAYDTLTAEVIYAKHVGRDVIAGVECEHLAFGTAEVDWELWVELGPRPIPRKYVLTTKMVARTAQYTLMVREWQTDTQPRASTFMFSPPAGATRVGTSDLKELTELPAGVTANGR
jgi:hypothetical protein